MNKERFMKEGADLKLVLLLLLGKWKRILVVTVILTCLSLSSYIIYYTISSSGAGYEAVSKYYITFDKIEDESFFDYYYNGYTWNELLSSDLIMGKVAENLSGSYTREYVDSCIDADILSDVRVLTTTVKAKDEEEASLFQKEIENAVTLFGNEGEKIYMIEVISSSAPEKITFDNNAWRAALLGFVAGFIIVILFSLFEIAVSDAIYLPTEFEERYNIPCAGMLYKNETEKDIMNFLSGKKKKDDEIGLHKELTANLEYLMEKKDVNAVSMEELLLADDNMYGKMRALDGVILLFPQGKKNSKLLTRVMRNISIQGCNVIAGVITETNETLIRTYYFGKKKKEDRYDA